MADSKSRADLEVELEQAQKAKLAAEDRLTTDRLSPLAERLAGIETQYRELEEGYYQAVETKQALELELAESKEAAEDAETVNEELQESDVIIASLTEQFDNNLAEMQEIRTQISGIQAEYDVRAEEIQMALLSNERTELLERRMSVMEGRFNELVANLRQLEAATGELQVKIDEATDARSSVEYILEDVEGRMSTEGVEAQIADLTETIEEKRQALESMFDTMEDLKEEMAMVSEEIEVDQSIVNEQTTVLESINDQLANYVDSVAPRNEALDALITKLSETTCHEDVYALSEDLGKFGFVIRTTTGGRAVLCRTYEGKVVADTVLEDFVFVSDPGNIYERFSDGTVNKIIDFVKHNLSESYKSELTEPVMIVNEDKQFAIDKLVNEAR